MLRLSKIAILFFLTLLLNCSSNDDIIETIALFKVITFGGSTNELGNSVISCDDGSYVVLGFTQSFDGDIITTQTEIQFDFWLLKFDSEDNLLWQKTYGGSDDEKGYEIINTSDNGFAIIGFSKSNDGDVNTNEGFDDVCIFKLDINGNIQWQKTTGFSGSDQGLSLIQTTDGGYFIGGILDVSASNGEGNSKSTAARHAGGDYWGIKLDSTGNIKWRRYFGGSNTDTCYDVTETTDGYILVGSSDSTDIDISNNKGSYDFWIVKIDKTGNLLWEKSFGGSQIDEARAIINTNDGNFIIVGDTRSSDQDIIINNGGADCWIIKINTRGELLWEKTFGGSSFDVARSIKNTSDGGFIISGSSRSIDKEFTNQGQNDAWILKISSEGNQEWQQTIGGSNIENKMKNFTLLFLTISAFIITSCSSNNDELAEKVDITINFNHLWDDDVITIDDFNITEYENDNDETLTIERLRYLISNIYVKNDNDIITDITVY